MSDAAPIIDRSVLEAGTADIVRSDPRRSGDVLRYHTWPTIQQQNIAHHTWNVMRILLTIWPSAPADVLVYAMFHDSGELGTGDLPYPVKATSPELKQIMDALEDQSLAEQGIEPLVCEGTWRNRMKLCDMIEMLEFGMSEVELGNRLALPIVERIQANLEARVAQLSESDRPPAVAYIDGRWDRHHRIMGRVVQI